MKYQKRLHWDRYRPEFLKIGFIFALAIAFMAFNYTTSYPVVVPFDVVPLDDDFMIEPPITVQQKKVTPPPPKKINIVDLEPATEPIVEFEEKVEYFKKTVESTELIENASVPEKAPIVEIIKEAPKDKGPLLFAERMPIYGACDEGNESERKDCTATNLIRHTYSHVRYPALARENHIEGTVVVSFVVNKSGKVEDVKIVRDIGMGCGNEVVRAIKKLGDFEPGKQNGRPVAVLYRFPVKFSLE